MNYKDYIIKKGDKELGILWSDIEEHLLTPAQYKEFQDYMIGSTCGLIKNIPVCYVGDFERFLRIKKI